MIVKHDPDDPKLIPQLVAAQMEAIFMLHHASVRFHHPKPYELDHPLDPNSNVWNDRWQCPPQHFLQYWRTHRNCDINPVSAYNSDFFRQEYEATP